MEEDTMRREILLILAGLLPCALGCASVSGRSLTDEPASAETRRITQQTAEQLRLIRVLTIPEYTRGTLSQCSVAFSPDGRLLVGACGRSRLPVWDVATGEVLHFLYDAPIHAVACAFHPDGETIAIGGLDDGITIFDVATGERVSQLGSDLSSIWEVDFSPDGTRLVSCSVVGEVRLWNIESREESWRYESSQGYLSVAFSPTGDRIAYGSLRDQVGLLDATTGDRVRHHSEPPHHTGDVTFNPSGTRLAAGCDDRRIYVWPVGEPGSVKKLTGHAGFVNGVAFSFDGTLLASGCHDGTVGVWDMDTGARLISLEGHDRAVLRVAFSPDGRTIVSISWDGTIGLWGLPEAN